MSHHQPHLLVYAPGGRSGAIHAAASSRAGALGVIDLSMHQLDQDITRHVWEPATRLTAQPLGVRVRSSRSLQGWLDDAPPSVRTVIGVEDSPVGWSRFCSEVLASQRIPLAEVTSEESARDAIAAGAIGLIAAGHEAGGRVSELSTLILTQSLISMNLGPVWSRGGIGSHSAAGCVAMGAQGVVLDGATLLARESSLGPLSRARITRMDGSETLLVGPGGAPRWRVLASPSSQAMIELLRAASEGGRAWNLAIDRWIGWDDDQAWPLGQDAAVADALSRPFVTVGGIVTEVNRQIESSLSQIRNHPPLSEDSPLARSHQTRYPIVQGPMTRVSDCADFAGEVADGGGLPMIALAMLKGPEVRELLSATQVRLRNKSWGVGLLGFVDPILRREQIAAVLEAKPRFALIAGGRPDQARELEESGIHTYLHVPSPGLLRQYLQDGSRRFVFEGRECGGHVGPRSSLLLWQQVITTLLEAVQKGLPADSIHALFAGGIHDRRSARCVEAIVAPLAAAGVKVGILVGTAYLFTKEAVSTGAIVPRFQQEAIRCGQTVLLETGPGHEVRVAPSPYVDLFDAARTKLASEGKSPEALREALESLNAGRLRVAAKGLERPRGASSPLASLDEDQQYDRGLYMLGQSALLRNRITSIDDLHRELCTAVDRVEQLPPVSQASPSDIAIVGMSAIFPGATHAREFWENTLQGLDAIREIPPDRWDWRLYYDADPKAPDKIVSKWGGFVPDIPFDPLRYGMPPNSLTSIEPVQLLTLEAVRAAIDDAGYTERPFPRDRTSVVLGIGGGAAQMAMGYAFRAYLPMLDAVSPGIGQTAMQACQGLLPEWTEDAFPGFLLNVAAGRVANRFDLGGSNYAVDAACGSSLAAALLAVRELETNAADMVILGGADTVQNPLTYLAFSKTHAFSPRGRCRPFDASADGIVISEGVSAIVLKRLADAERDGDRIYAVIKGIGSSSDGRARGLTAPNPEGQSLALNRAYEKAGVDPRTVGYVEAHGTGTAVGDVVETQALASLLTNAGAAEGTCFVGSVKSSIGHTKCAAGMAGLINAALALHHKVLPPTIGVDTINPRLTSESSPLRISTEISPWIHVDKELPRRAGVSAFGFGGTNFHAVLEAYDRNLVAARAPSSRWPAELFAWSESDRGSLLARLDAFAEAIVDIASSSIVEIAGVNHRDFTMMDRGPVVALIVNSIADLKNKLADARRILTNASDRHASINGVFVTNEPAFRGSPISFLFPGQGTQSPGMVKDLAIAFDSVRSTIEEFDRTLIAADRRPVGKRIFPPRPIDDQRKIAQRDALRSPEIAQPAVGAVSTGLLRLLGELGVKPDLVAGHSYGEFVALHAAGCLSASHLAEVSEARGRFLLDAVGDEPGSMAALAIGPERVKEVLNGWTDVLPVNFNGPGQTVVAGTRDAVSRVMASARDQGLGARELSVACAFHTSLVSGAVEPLTDFLNSRLIAPPSLPVYSNLDAKAHPEAPSRIVERMGRHLASPVKFTAMIEAMHDDGARVFVECGPSGILSPIVTSILTDRPHVSIAVDSPGKTGLPGLLDALARLIVSGVTVDLRRLSSDRVSETGSLAEVVAKSRSSHSASTWLVNGSRARPIHDPEPRRLGQVMSPVTQLAPSPPPSRCETSPVSIPQATSAAQAPEGDRVLVAFQETMRQFLDLQQSTMNAYLASKNKQPVSETSVIRVDREPERVPASVANEQFQTRADPIHPPTPGPSAVVPIAATRVDRDAIAARLIAIVCDRTGYPGEMLRPDLDLEADLGIDSIKRVEILGSLRESFPEVASRLDASAMDDLARARTLGDMAERFARGIAAMETCQPSSLSTVRRFVIESGEAPLPEGTGVLAEGGVVIVTDDGHGLSAEVCSRIEARGHSTVVVPLVTDSDDPLATREQVDLLLDCARGIGPIAAIVHLRTLNSEAVSTRDAATWSARLDSEMSSLFHLAQAVAEDLEESARQGGSCLITATAMGGEFGSLSELPATFLPHQGGVVGLVKTLAREWTSVRVRVVDLDPQDHTSLLAGRVLDELFAEDPRSEVGYRNGRRKGLAARESRRVTGSKSLVIRRGQPILLTGGARGITSAVARELARRWHPRFLIVGTTPEPRSEESPLTSNLEDPRAIKSQLLDVARTEGRQPSPSAIESSFQALMRSREVSRNLKALRNEGVEVAYGVADVRDPDALEALLREWRSRYGPLAGVIHGAGVIHDKLLKDKKPASFDRVFGTKVFGMLNLLQLVDLEALDFFAVFSSIAGRFGNRGQSDYAAANETLNKLAIALDRQIPGRVLSAIWGPWSGVGMVSDLETHLGRQGLTMISPNHGAAAFADELAYGRKGEVEVILAGSLGMLAEPPGPRSREIHAEALP